MNWEDVPGLLDRLADLWPGYHPRPGQSQMARAVAQAVDTARTILVEGGTGVGKSIAYLLPAALSALEDDKRTLIATSHKQLQDQLSTQDLPRIDALMQDLGYPGLAWTTLKGMASYVCRQAVDSEVIAAEPHPLVPWIQAWLGGDGHHGELDEMPFAVPGELRARLSVEIDECLHDRCPHFEDCFALAARRRAAAVPIVVTNHALLALHAASDNRLLPGPFDSIVIDEAHAFEDAATRAFGFECPSRALRRLLRSEIMRRAAPRELLDAARTLCDRLDAEVTRRLGAEATALREPLLAGLDLADALEALGTAIDPQRQAGRDSYPFAQSPFDLDPAALEALKQAESARQRTSRRALSLANRLRTIASADDSLLVYYVEPASSPGAAAPEDTAEEQGPFGPGASPAFHPYTLLALPLDVSPFLEEWWEGQATVLTSATLTDGRSFRFFSERLGVGAARPQRLIVPSPFDYAGRTRLVLAPVLGQDRPDSGYYDRLADQIARLLDATGGKCLLLFTSHRALEAVWARLQMMRIAGWKLYRQGDASQAQIKEAYRVAAPDACLATFASRSWWQGIDMPGMRLVVMDKLPFPQLGDPLVAARTALIEEQEGQSFQQYMLPLALIAFRQGFGRLMRNEHDFGAVAICDARLVHRQYGARFIEALPAEIPVLQTISALRAWVHATQAAVGPTDPSDVDREETS